MKLEFIDKYMLCWLHMAFQSKAAAELLNQDLNKFSGIFYQEYTVLLTVT